MSLLLYRPTITCNNTLIATLWTLARSFETVHFLLISKFYNFKTQIFVLFISRVTSKTCSESSILITEQLTYWFVLTMRNQLSKLPFLALFYWRHFQNFVKCFHFEEISRVIMHATKNMVRYAVLNFPTAWSLFLPYLSLASVNSFQARFWQNRLRSLRSIYLNQIQSSWVSLRFEIICSFKLFSLR